MRYCRNRDQKKVKMHGVLYRSMVQYFASMCKPLMSFPLLPPSSASRAIPSCMFINVMMMKKKKKSVVLLYDAAVFLVSSRYQIVVSQLQQYSSYSFDCVIACTKIQCQCSQNEQLYVYYLQRISHQTTYTAILQ